MKKILGGCLIITLLALVVGGGATWWFVLRPAWNAGSQFMNAASQVAELAKLDETVKNRSAFSPPADGRISEAALDRFIATQQAIQARVGTNLATLEAKYRQIETDAKTAGKRVGPSEVLGAYGDLFSLVREAKEAQVEALNAQNLSLEEYRWLRKQAYAALAGSALASTPTEEGSALTDNAKQLAPHRELLTRTAVGAWLGL